MILDSAALLAVATIYQFVAAPLFAVSIPGVGTAAPDFLLVAVVFVAVNGHSWSGFAVAVLAGTLADVASIQPPLTHTIAYIAAAGMGNAWRRRGLGGTAPANLLLVASASASARLAAGAWLWLADPQRAPLAAGSELLSLAYDAIVGLAVLSGVTPRLSRGRKEATWSARA